MSRLSSKKEVSLKKIFFQWEWGLILLFLIINIVNASISSNYFVLSKLLTVTRSFLDKAFIVFPMCMILLMGEIDISVASIVAFSSTIMAVTHQWAGVPIGLSMILCLAAAGACGMFNGFLLTKFPELPPMIVTFFGQLLYRGIAEYMLKGEALSGYPSWFKVFGWSSFLGIPIMLWAFIGFGVIFYFVIHRSNFGRYVYAIGSNRTAARYSGVNVEKIRFIVYTLTGIMAGVCSIFLTSRTTSTRSNIAKGYELDVIAMVIVGGVSSSGGRGRLIGPIIAVFIIGFLRYGLGLANIESEYLVAVIGGLLVISALIPNLLFEREEKKKAGKTN